MKTYKSVALTKKLNPFSVTYHISYVEPVLKTARAAGISECLPKTLTILYPAADGTQGQDAIPAESLLYVGDRLLSQREWEYDAAKRALHFKTSSVSGYFEMERNAQESQGMLSCGGEAFAASIVVAPITYELSVAKGAAYVSTAGVRPVLVYSEDSPEWKSAWEKQRQDNVLKFTYQLEGSPVVGQQVYDLAVQFETPDGDIWIPDSGTYSAIIDGDFNISFCLNLNERPEEGSPLYPYRLQGKLDPFGQTMTGAMLTGEDSALGTAYGVQGRYVDESTVCGTYQLDGSGETFSVLGGRLYIDGTELSGVSVDGGKLSWDDSCNERAEALRKVLPASGVLCFSPDGAAIVGADTPGASANGLSVKGRRLTAEEVLRQRRDMPENSAEAESETHPGYTDLLAMTPYETDSAGSLIDTVQDKSMKSFMLLLQHYVPEDLYKQFINMNLDNLPEELNSIFRMKDGKGNSPYDVYAPYTTAYLTGILSTAHDDYAGKLNRARADKYISTKLPLNDLYRKQAPLIYKQVWMKKFPKLQEYLSDQENYKEYYASMIAEDCAGWKKDAEKSFDLSDEESRKALSDYQSHIGKIAEEAQLKGKYWAYFLLRYTMTPSFLSALQNASLSGVSSTSLITQKVQQISALLTVLDTDADSVFVQEFAKSVEIFQLSNILPVLFDLGSGTTLEEYSYAVEKILREFAQKYADSADKTLANYAKYIRSLSAEDFGKLYNCMVYAYNSLDGAFIYSKFVANFDSKFLKVFGKLPQLAAYGCIIGAVVTGIIMFASGRISWKDLSTFQRVKLIGTGVGLFAAAAVKVTQRAMLVGLLTPKYGLFKRVGIFFWCSKENKIAALLTPELINSRFKKWIIGDAGLGSKTLSDMAQIARLSTKANACDRNLIVKLLGTNLDEAMVRGLGIIFAIVGIVMSSIDLSKGGDDMTVAANALFLASSCLDLIAIGAGMLGFEAASSVLGVVGIVTVLAGFILVMIEITKKKPTPIESFAKNRAAGMGFYMPYGYDIDSFKVIPPSGSIPSRSGAAFYVGSTDHSLVMNADGTVSLGKYDGKASTSLGLDVDAEGNLRVYAILEDTEGQSVALYLTHCADGKIKAMPYATDSADKSQIWKCKASGRSSRDEGKYLVSADFSISDGGSTPKYLTDTGTGLSLGDSAQNWTVELKAAGADGLSMQDISLHTFDRDRKFSPTLRTEGSDPKTYSVSPALPEFMQFDKDTGRISQKKGVAPTVTAKSSYRLSLTDALGQVLPPAEFTFEVCEVEK